FLQDRPAITLGAGGPVPQVPGVEPSPSLCLVAHRRSSFSFRAICARSSRGRLVGSCPRLPCSTPPARNHSRRGCRAVVPSRGASRCAPPHAVPPQDDSIRGSPRFATPQIESSLAP